MILFKTYKQPFSLYTHVYVGILLMYLTCSGATGAGNKSDNISGDLIIFHAGSLSMPFKQISDAFQRVYPDVRVKREVAGSRVCARKISELKKPCDIMASADYTVIDTLLIPEFASWNIRFAANEMSLVYHDKSRYAGTITASNWVDVLMNPAVAFGRSDPNSDPCGYRAVLTMKLAEKYYARKGLAARMLKKDTRHIRPKETDLLALLDAGEIDYIFLYRSVGIQHGLKVLRLSDSVNLKNPEYNTVYKTASVKISGRIPGSNITKTGQAIVYGVTIPNNPPNPKAAMAFIQFLLDKNTGRAIMEKNGQESVVPSPTPTYEKLPTLLKPYAQQCPVPAVTN